jgi:hypothetical protein
MSTEQYEEVPFFTQDVPTRIGPADRRRNGRKKLLGNRFTIGDMIRHKVSGYEGRVIDVFGTNGRICYQVEKRLGGGWGVVAQQHAERVE